MRQIQDAKYEVIATWRSPIERKGPVNPDRFKISTDFGDFILNRADVGISPRW